jgi:cytochrome c-type biogenesis protein CcmH
MRITRHGINSYGMTIWFIFALMTALALAAMLAPLLKSRAPEADRAAFDRAIFKDQLAELERDAARGIIGKAEAEAARNEISRRIIAAAPEPKLKPIRAPYGAFFAALAVPAIAVPLYLKAGSPGMGDVPQAERLAKAEDAGDMAAMVYKVEKAVAENPDDAKGWEILARVYTNLERFGDAANAYANLVRLGPPSAQLLADYGEALSFARGGSVSAEALKVFEEAAKFDPKLPKTRFFLAMAMKQAGKAPEARAAFEALLADAPADATWRRAVEAQIDKGPSAANVAAAQEMAPDDRMAMVRSMVEGLEEKLKADGSDQEGWARLIRSRTVLGEMDKARAAYAAAQAALKGRPEALTQLAAIAKELGVAQ